MAYRIAHQVRFDDRGRLFSEQRLLIPSIDLPHDLTLDAFLTEQLNRDYFANVNRLTLSLYHPIVDDQQIRIRMPQLGTILMFGNKQVIVNADRAEIAWSILGGAMLARQVEKGGRLIIGAEWYNRPTDQLTLYTRVEDYTSRIIGMFGPRIGIFIYRLTQGVSHKFITHRFLRNEAKRLSAQLKRR